MRLLKNERSLVPVIIAWACILRGSLSSGIMFFVLNKYLLYTHNQLTKVSKTPHLILVPA